MTEYKGNPQSPENVQIGRDFRAAVYTVFEKYMDQGVPLRRLFQILAGQVTLIGLEIKMRRFFPLLNQKESDHGDRQG